MLKKLLAGMLVGTTFFVVGCGKKDEPVADPAPTTQETPAEKAGEKMANDFDTVLAAHHQKIADAVSENFDSLYGTPMMSSEFTTTIGIKTEGIDVNMDFSGSGQQDISDTANQKSDIVFDADIKANIDNPEFFPMAVNADATANMDLRLLGLVYYFKLNELNVALEGQEDVATLIMNSVEAFKGKWIKMDLEELPGYDETSTELGQNFVKIGSVFAESLVKNPIFKLVEAMEDEGDYYVYKVELDQENVTNILADVLRELDPAFTDADEQAWRDEMLAEDVAVMGVLKVHSRDVEDYSFTTSAQEEGEDVAEMTIASSAKTFSFELISLDPTDSGEFKLSIQKGDESSRGNFNLVIDEQEFMKGSFRYKFEDLNVDFDMSMTLNGVAMEMPEDLTITMKATSTGEEVDSVDIEAPADALTFEQLGIPLDGGATPPPVPVE